MLKAGDVVILTKDGLDRVLEGKHGMTFLVDAVTQGAAGPVAHVRDYRYGDFSIGKHYCIWSIQAYGYVLPGDLAP